MSGIDETTVTKIIAKNPLAQEFSRIYKLLRYRSDELLCYITSKNKDHYTPDGEKFEIEHLYVNLDFVCLSLKELIESLVELYPQIAMDYSFIKVRDGLKNYRKKKTGFISKHLGWVEIDEDILRQVSENLGRVKSKVFLVKSSLEDIENSLYELPKGPTQILEAMKAFKKDTDPIRKLATKMKGHVADTDIWKNFRNTWKQLNEQLEFFGFPSEYLELSEKIIRDVDNRYPTSSKLNPIDMKVCNELMNEIVDTLDVYDSTIK